MTDEEQPFAPQGHTLELQEFVEFGVTDAPWSLMSLLNNGFQPFYMPQLLDEKIAAVEGSKILKRRHSTPSAIIIAKANDKNVYAVVVHEYNFFSDPKNYIPEKVKERYDGFDLKPEWFRILTQHFDTLVQWAFCDTVLKIKYQDFCAWPNGDYGIYAPTKKHMERYGGKINGIDMLAINHPFSKMFCGNLERAINFFDKMHEIHGQEEVWINPFVEYQHNRVNSGWLDTGDVVGENNSEYLSTNDRCSASRFVGAKIIANTEITVVSQSEKQY